MEQFSQNTYWTQAEDVKNLKGQERSPHNRVGWKKKKKKKEAGWELLPCEGAEKEESFPNTEKSPHRRGDQPGQRESFRGSAESTTTSLQQAERERPAQMVCTTLLCSQHQMCIHLVRAGAGCWNSGFRGQTQGEDWGWLHGDSLKGLEHSMVATRGVHGRNQGLPQKWSATVKSHVKGGVQPTTAASLHTIRHLSGLWECTCQLPPQWAPEAGASGWPTQRGWAEIIAESQGPHNLGSRTEISPHSCASHHWLCELSACGASEQTKGAPVAEMDLALASVDIVGACTWGLGWVRV